MLRKFEVSVGYPWAGVEDDKEVVELDIPDDIEDEDLYIDNELYDYALDMIFTRGISIGYEEIENGES